MAKSTQQKMKLLYLMRIFSERSDETHLLTMEQLRNELEQYGISAERKSIYDDLEDLRQFGLDIIYQSGKHGGYYLASREFELPELKLLVDAVQASKFITVKKSEELIKKLERLTSKYEASKLQRQVYVTNRVKTENERIYYNVDLIHSAMYENVKITFQYLEWTVSKTTVPKKGGQQYKISPWVLLWEESNYYLIGYDDAAGMVKYYRVDKMQSTELSKESREGTELFRTFDTAAFAKKTFGMFSGEEELVTLCCDNHFIGIMMDRFGTGVTIRSVDKTKFSMQCKVAVSAQFFGWLSGLGTGVTVEAPERVRVDYVTYLDRLLAQYK